MMRDIIITLAFLLACFCLGVAVGSLIYGWGRYMRLSRLADHIEAQCPYEVETPEERV